VEFYENTRKLFKLLTWVCSAAQRRCSVAAGFRNIFLSLQM